MLARGHDHPGWRRGARGTALRTGTERGLALDRTSEREPSCAISRGPASPSHPVALPLTSAGRPGLRVFVIASTSVAHVAASTLQGAPGLVVRTPCPIAGLL